MWITSVNVCKGSIGLLFRNYFNQTKTGIFMCLLILTESEHHGDQIIFQILLVFSDYLFLQH